MNSKNHKGFTLIEVIFSILLLGILGTSIFLLQGSILRQVALARNKISTAIFMHNSYIKYRIKSLYNKKTMPDFLQHAVQDIKIEKKPLLHTKDEKIKFNKLFELIVTQEPDNNIYAKQEHGIYIWYDPFFKENDAS